MIARLAISAPSTHHAMTRYPSKSLPCSEGNVKSEAVPVDCNVPVVNDEATVFGCEC